MLSARTDSQVATGLRVRGQVQHHVYPLEVLTPCAACVQKIGRHDIRAAPGVATDPCQPDITPPGERIDRLLAQIPGRTGHQDIGQLRQDQIPTHLWAPPFASATGLALPFASGASSCSTVPRPSKPTFPRGWRENRTPALPRPSWRNKLPAQRVLNSFPFHTTEAVLAESWSPRGARVIRPAHSRAGASEAIPARVAEFVLMQIIERIADKPGRMPATLRRKIERVAGMGAERGGQHIVFNCNSGVVPDLSSPRRLSGLMVPVSSLEARLVVLGLLAEITVLQEPSAVRAPDSRPQAGKSGQGRAI